MKRPSDVVLLCLMQLGLFWQENTILPSVLFHCGHYFNQTHSKVCVYTLYIYIRGLYCTLWRSVGCSFCGIRFYASVFITLIIYIWHRISVTELHYICYTYCHKYSATCSLSNCTVTGLVYWCNASTGSRLCFSCVFGMGLTETGHHWESLVELLVHYLAACSVYLHTIYLLLFTFEE